MSDLCMLIWCALIGLFRSRAALEAEILVLRHQLNVLRRKSPKRLALPLRDQSSCGTTPMAGRPNPQGRLKLILAPCYRSTAMRACIAIVFLLLIDPGWALDLVIKDGDTLTLDGTEFRLDGIDAPEKDQVCVD